MDMEHSIAYFSQATVSVIINISLNLSMKTRSSLVYHLDPVTFFLSPEGQEQLPLMLVNVILEAFPSAYQEQNT